MTAMPAMPALTERAIHALWRLPCASQGTWRQGHGAPFRRHVDKDRSADVCARAGLSGVPAGRATPQVRRACLGRRHGGG